MSLSSSFFVAFAALILGGGLLVLVWWSLRWLAPRQAQTQAAPPTALEPEADEPVAGVLVVQSGGRVLVNERARELFGLDGQAPNLERLIHRVQPSETFQALLIAEGEADLNIGEHRVAATSVRMPLNDRGLGQMVLVLRENEPLQELATTDEKTLQAVRLVADIGRDVAASLELNKVFDAVLGNVGRLFSYNRAEITLWDEANQVLRSARRVGDEVIPVDNEDSASRSTSGADPSNWMGANRPPMLVRDPDGDARLTPLRAGPDGEASPFQSYLGAPLHVGTGQRFLGTLELASYKPNVYKQSDALLLNLIAEQAANAIHNAQLFAEQQRRVAELTGLAEITRAIESTSEPRELYGRLTGDIARFIGVQMVGFLFYDAHEDALIGQSPFYGVPDIVANFYHISVKKGSPAAALWHDQEYWLSNDVAHDPMVEAMGLRQLAETAGVKATLMAPIALGGRRLGVVQVSNKLNGAPFTEMDVRLLSIFAGQAAAILDNARLVREAQSRAEQAEGLRQIATTAAGGNNLDEILRTAMRQAASLLHFDIGILSLLDEARGELAPHPASVYGGPPEAAQSARLRTDDPFFNVTVTRTRRAFRTGRAITNHRISGIYRPMVEHYQVHSVMDVPLVVGDRSIGEMMVGARRERAFSRADQQLLSTIAAQLASAIERTRLYTSTDQDLSRRVDQLTALTRVGRELNQTLQLERVLLLVHDEAIHATQAHGGTIVLLNTNAATPQIEVRIGEEELGPQLTPLEQEVAAGAASLRHVTHLEPDSPFALPSKPEVKAALVAPILTQGVVGGLIHLLSHSPEGFDDTAIETATALAAQTAIAVVNAQRYEEQLKRGELLRRRADQLAQLFEISQAIRSDRSLISNLETIAFGLQEAVGFNVVLISVLDPQTRRLRRTASAGIPINTFQKARQVEQPWETVAHVLGDEFRISQSYFLPYEKSAEITAVLDTISLAKTMPEGLPATAWHPEDMLIVPLRSPAGEQDPIGILTLDDPRNGLRPDRGTIEVVEIFANQAALAIENTRLFQAAERRAARLLALHRVIERASREPDRTQVWQTVADALWAEMGRDVCLVALLEGGRLVLKGRAGRLGPQIDFGPMLAAEFQNPLTQVLADLKPLLVPSVKESPWVLNALVIATEVRSFISSPILSNGQPTGALFVGSLRTPTPFVPEDVDLFLILSNQLGAILESAQLEADIRARAAQLAALAVVSRTITAALRVEDVIQAILTNLRTIIPYDSVTLWLREGDQLRSAAAQGFEDDAERLGLQVNIADSALFDEMARTRNAILVPDVQTDERFPASALQPTRSWLGAPLVSKERILGALALDKREPHFYSPLATQVLMAFANQAAVALDNAQLFEESGQRTLELDKRSQRLALLNRFSGQLSGTLKLDRVFEITLTEVMDALNVELGAMVSYDDQGEPTVVKQILTVPSTFDAHNPALLRVRESLAPLAVEDVTQDTVLEPARTSFLSRNVKSLLAVPLVVGGIPVAALQLEVAHTPRRFTPDEVELAQTLANQAAVAIQNARLYAETQARLNELATFDQISRAISSTLDIEQVFQIVGDQVSAVMGVDNLSLALYDEAMQQLSFPIFMEHGRHIPAEPRAVSGLAARVIQTRRPLLLRGHDPRSLGAAARSTPTLSSGAERPKEARGQARSHLGVPLIIGDRVAGVLAVQDWERPNAFDYGHERVLTTIAAQVVVALENARLFAEVQVRAAELSQRNERLSALNRLSATLSTSLALPAILEHAAEQVAHLFRVDHCGVVLFDEQGESGEVYAEYPRMGALGAQLPLKEYPLHAPRELLAGRVPVAVDDVTTDPRLSATLRASLEQFDIRSLLIVPFISQNEVIGSFSLDALHEPRTPTWTTDDMELCQTIAAQIASAIENARFTHELETRVASRTQDVERERERVETLLQISTELSSSLDLNRVLSRALQLVTEVVNAPRGSVFILDLESDQLIHRAAQGRGKPLPPNGELAPFKRNEGLVGWVMKNRQGVVIGDLEQDPRWKQLPDHPGRHHSALAVPLMANEDALGVMILLSPEYNAFDEDQLRLVSAAADRVGDAINNAELYRLIREQAEKLGALLREQQVEATKSRAILEGIADGVLVAEAGGNVILFNAACERVLDLKRSRVIGRPVTEFLGIYGAAGKAWLEAVDRWSADPYSYTPGDFFDERIETDNQRVLSVHLAPVIDSDEFLGSVSVIRDITREVEVDRLKSEFVTNVSHELRTPMTSIKGYADILLMGAAGPLTDNQSRFLDVIKNNADRLSILVNDLLDISRIESGQVQLVLRPIQIGEVITIALDTLRGRIDEENKPMELVADAPPDLPPVHADRERLTQIIMNLADNAFNYSKAGGVITLRARVDPAQKEMVIEVSDSGIGVAPEDQDRLFDRFYRGEDELVLATAGTGLGLPIARQLAEMHGGRLWLAHSAPGQGSTFALSLPLNQG